MSIIFVTLNISAQTEKPFVSKVWSADNGDGNYKNPVLHADYSDPDAIRVGDDFYLTASSFNAAPGLPILHSKDLVNWKLIGYVFQKQNPADVFDKPQHGGGVPTGWQLVLRSKNIYGPYEEKIVLAQGKSATNGSHQGAWVTTQTGEDWFLHFQDKGAYGRILHLEPMTWKNDFPVVGIDPDGDGAGEPVAVYKKPNVGSTFPVQTPPDSDEFNDPTLGLQWQWQANPQSEWAFPFPAKGVLRMNSVQLPENFKNLWDAPNLLLQKFPAEEFTATAKVTLNPRFDGEKFGLLVMGMDYSYIAVTNDKRNLYVAQRTAKDADKGSAEIQSAPVALNDKTFYLRVKISKTRCANSVSARTAKITRASACRSKRVKDAGSAQKSVVFFAKRKIQRRGNGRC